MLGWKVKIIGFFVFKVISDLKIVVDVGFVVGVILYIMLIGLVIFIKLVCLFLLIIFIVLLCLILF